MDIIKLIKNILIAIIIALIAWFLWEFFLIIGIYNNLVNYLLNKLFLNIWLVRSIAVIFTLVTLTILIPAINRVFNPLISRHKKNVELIKITIVLIGYFLLIYFRTYNFNIDKCFAYDFEGNYIICDCSAKIHPFYLTEVKPMSREIAIYLEKKKAGKLREDYFKPNKNYHFFASDGTALVWYCIKTNGEYDFSEIPGKHKVLGIEMQPVTKEVVVNYFNWLETKSINTNEETTQGQSDLYKQLDNFTKN